MAKRFTDTEKYNKSFIRSLPAPYKLLWDYLYHECDHAGIWHKDFEVAQIKIGKDAPIDEGRAIEFFNKDEVRVVVLGGRKKWFIRPFIEFQYGELNPENRAHASVIRLLERLNIKGLLKGLIRGLEAPKDKDKDKDSSSSLSSSPPPSSIKKNRELTEIQKVVEAWKIVVGAEEDPGWDKLNFPRCSKSAKQLLDYFGNWEMVSDCMEEIYNRLSSKGLTVTLETIVKHASTWKAEKEGMKDGGVLSLQGHGGRSFNR